MSVRVRVRMVRMCVRVLMAGCRRALEAVLSNRRARRPPRGPQAEAARTPSGRQRRRWARAVACAGLPTQVSFTPLPPSVPHILFLHVPLPCMSTLPFWTAPQASDFLQGHAAASAAKRFFRPDRLLRAPEGQILAAPGGAGSDFGTPRPHPGSRFWAHFSAQVKMIKWANLYIRVSGRVQPAEILYTVGSVGTLEYRCTLSLIRRAAARNRSP